MTKLLLIRHAQSLNNAKPEHLRIPDPGLTDLGHEQAKRAASWLARWEVTQLYSSPFLRALQTVAPISRQLGMSVNIRADIFEQGGCYQGHLPGEEKGEPGMTRSEILRHYPAWDVDGEISDEGWWKSRPFETWEQATVRARRVASWLSATIATQDGCHAIVTHGDFKRILIYALLDDEIDERRFGPIYNTSITQFVARDGRWVLDSYNTTSHLAPNQLTL